MCAYIFLELVRFWILITLYKRSTKSVDEYSCESICQGSLELQKKDKFLGRKISMVMRISLVLVLVSFLACNKKYTTAVGPKKTDNQELTELDWMLGKWKREDTGQLALWSKKENSFFGGMMVKLTGEKRAVIQEVRSLEGRHDGIYYSSKDKGTRHINRSEYKMSNTNFQAPKFTNPEGGFPKNISYMKIGNDKIKVELEGEGRETSFYYIREM